MALLQYKISSKALATKTNVNVILPTPWQIVKQVQHFQTKLRQEFSNQDISLDGC